MKYAMLVSTSICALVISLAAAAWPQCNNPSSPGVVICTPTNGSTVVYLNEVSVRSTAAQGAAITGFSIYDHDALIYQSGSGQSGIDLYDGAIFNGNHDLIVKASDTAGNEYQAESKFQVVGQGYGACAIPTSPGINFCQPSPGAVYSTSAPVGAAARGQSPIKEIAFSLNGQLKVSAQNTPTLATVLQVQQQGVSNLVTVTAIDSDGNKYSANKTVVAAYTYGQYSCFYTCTPGISVVTPQSEAYVGNTFNVDMQIEGNPQPITKMEAYLDKALVATSNGPSLQQEVTSAPNGTHILTVKGFDTQGTEYLIQENININVSE